jgi:hypothetical protein
MDEPDKRTRSDPASGWTLGAGGLPKSAWFVLALLAIIFGAVMLGIGYLGYGLLIVIVGLAAAANLF